MKNSEKLIQTIRQQEIKPIPKWQFLLKNGSLWVGFVSATILGALAFSVILFVVQQTDFKIISHLSHSRLELFLGLLPFIWIVFLLFFLGVAFFSIRNSKKGYKFTLSKLAGFSAAASILLGTLFFIVGGAQHLEQAFAVNVSLYESIQEKKVRLWTMPEEGYLSGEIISVNPDFIYLNDFESNNWKINYGNANMPPVILLEEGEKIKIIGFFVTDGEFVADEIRPWGGERRGQKRN